VFDVPISSQNPTRDLIGGPEHSPTSHFLKVDRSLKNPVPSPPISYGWFWNDHADMGSIMRFDWIRLSYSGYEKISLRGGEEKADMKLIEAEGQNSGLSLGRLSVMSPCTAIWSLRGLKF
jgi:hypothetical protein